MNTRNKQIPKDDTFRTYEGKKKYFMNIHETLNSDGDIKGEFIITKRCVKPNGSLPDPNLTRALKYRLTYSVR